MIHTQRVLPSLEAVTTANFRRACGQFATGITIITVHGPEGPHGMTANSFTSVSLEPPLILVSIDYRRRIYELLEGSDLFGISVLGEDHQPWSDRFAGRHGDIQGDFSDVPHMRTDDGLPLIDGALARFVCRRTAIYPAGDHALFIGQVEQLDHQSDGAPLLYFNGAYRNFGG